MNDRIDLLVSDPPLTAEEQEFLRRYRAERWRWHLLCWVFGFEPVKATLFALLWWQGWSPVLLVSLAACCVLVLAFLGIADEERQERAEALAAKQREYAERAGAFRAAALETAIRPAGASGH
jgi:hypothetical protein